MPTHPLDGRDVEEVGVVFEPAEDFVRPVLAQLQQQVELRRARVDQQIRGPQPRHRQVLSRGVLEAEHHLEQRVTAQVARGLKLLDQLLEGQLLVRVRGHAHVLRATQQLAEGGVAVQVIAQHQRVDEEADQRLQLRHIAAGDGRADRDVRLPRVPVHQRLERGQQRHEEGGPLLLADLLERAREGDREGDELAGASVRLLGRARPVGGQLQRRGQGAQVLLPERQLRAQPLALHALALPDGEVGVLDGGLRQLGRLAGDSRGVEGHQLADEDAQGPTVRHQVVHGDEGHVVVGAQAQHLAAQERPARQVEQPLGLLAGAPLHLDVLLLLRQVGDVLHRDVQAQFRQYDLHGDAVLARGEHGAQ